MTDQPEPSLKYNQQIVNPDLNSHVICLDVRNLTVSVKKGEKTCKILEKVSFKIDEGEILGLAGESGCGKSVTALSVSGLLPEEIRITEGAIIYKNRDLASLGKNKMRSIHRSEISLIFQDSRQALNPLMKAGDQIIETIALGENKEKKSDYREQRAQLKQCAKNREIVLELLSFLGFGNPQSVYNAYPHQLSGGMCQRIMTAIAVIKRPGLLIGDELSSSLDEESTARCMSLLLEMNKNNRMSFLFISHDLSMIQKYCSRFIIMYAGRIVEEGPASSLFTPHHPYTKALVNAIPNKDKRGKTLEYIGGKIPSLENYIEGCPFAPRCPKAKDICKKTFPQPAQLNQHTQKEGKIYCYFPD